MTALELIAAGRFAEAGDALNAELARCADPREAIALIERARRAALAARAAAAEELRRADRKRLLRGY